MSLNTPAIDLVPEVRCPNCWHSFPPEEALFISGHETLRGDPRFESKMEQRRFLPTRFSPDGAAIDASGTKCRDLACPNCHLLVPRVLLERRETLFLSIFGRPSAGKSYFLASMMRQMRRTLPQRFRLGVTEPHPPSNRLVQEYENAIFNHPDENALVEIARTEVSGQRWYQKVRFGDELRQYPRPMFFQIAPMSGHPNSTKALRYTRTLCLYDNSGEDFLAGRNFSPNNPVTQHLAKSAGLFFVFDPTQETDFLRACAGRSADPQVHENMRTRVQDAVRDPQSTVLSNADQNVKRFLGREVAQPLDTPLVIIVAKHDAWSHLLPGPLPDYFIPSSVEGNAGGLRISKLVETSQRIHDLIVRLAPEIEAAANRFSRHVYYVPVSATGCAPRIINPDHGPDTKPDYQFRVGDIKPQWIEVPLLWMLSQHVPGLVPMERGAAN